jgi:hypothetical protein
MKALSGKWRRLDCFSSLRNYRNILYPIRTKDISCSCRFIGYAVPDVFPPLTTP